MLHWTYSTAMELCCECHSKRIAASVVYSMPSQMVLTALKQGIGAEILPHTNDIESQVARNFEQMAALLQRGSKLDTKLQEGAMKAALFRVIAVGFLRVIHCSAKSGLKTVTNTVANVTNILYYLLRLKLPRQSQTCNIRLYSSSYPDRRCK